MSDNTLGGARSLGKLTGTKKRSGFVGQSDKIDIFKFTLTGRRSCSFNLKNLTANANLELLNSKGRILKASRKGGTKSEVINRTLDEGTYYVRIRRISGNTKYQLTASAVLPPDDTTPNATNIGVLSSYTRKDSIGDTDEVDYYKFTLNQISNFSGSIVGSSSTAYMYLYYDANNNGLIESSEYFESGYGSSSSSSSPVSLVLPKGTYFVEVKPYFEATNYTLSLTATANAGTLTTDPGEATTAYNIGVLSSSTTVKDYVGDLDEVDYFKFSLNQISNFNASITGSPSSAYMTLYYDANGNGLVDSGEDVESGSGSPSSSDPISRILPKGTYFLAVDTYYDAVKYNLNLSATANAGNLPTDPGPSTSPYIIPSTSNFVAKEYVSDDSPLDTVDYYKFTLNQISDVNASMVASDSTTYMTFYYDANNNGLVESGEQFAYGSGSPTSSDPVSQTMPKGTYFVYVYTGGDSNKYTFSLNAIANAGTLATDPGPATSPYNIGALTTTFSAKEYVGELDEVDYYKFSVASTTNLNASIVGASRTAYMQLYYDSNSNGLIDNGEFLKSGSGSTTSSNPITESLSAGSYFLYVYANGDGTKYDLTLTPS